MMEKHLLLPKIFRFITDSFGDTGISFKKVRFISLVLIGISMLFLLIVSGIDLYSNYQSKNKIDLERQEIISKIGKWQGIVNKYKDYRDAYFQLAILEYRLKDFGKSKVYLDIVLGLDPNFEKGRKLGKILNR